MKRYNKASMKRSTKVAASPIRTAVLVYFSATPAFAQISQIDRAKLPQNRPVQQVYDALAN